jgi:hypothetical protein
VTLYVHYLMYQVHLSKVKKCKATSIQAMDLQVWEMLRIPHYLDSSQMVMRLSASKFLYVCFLYFTVSPSLTRFALSV